MPMARKVVAVIRWFVIDALSFAGSRSPAINLSSKPEIFRGFGQCHLGAKVSFQRRHSTMKSVHFDSNDGVFTGKIVVVVKNKSILKKY